MSKHARPPGRTSISRTVQVNPSGPNHWQKASASVHAANTASRAASRTRTRTISRSRAHVVWSVVVGSVVVGVLLMTSRLLQCRGGCGSDRRAPEVRVQAVEPLLPCSAGVLGPCGDLDQRL